MQFRIGSSVYLRLLQHNILREKYDQETHGIHTSGQPQWWCNVDGCDFNNFSNRRHHNHLPCPKCGKMFENKYTLRGHLHYHESKPWLFEIGPGRKKCLYCSVFTTKRGRIAHLRRMHPEKIPKQIIFSCYVCSAQKAWAHSMINHLKTHSNIEYKCCFEGCDERFDSDDMLLCHLKRHQQRKCETCNRIRTYDHNCGRTSFICDICGKTFNNGKVQFIEHMNTHMNRRPFSCDICGKAFCKPSTLRVHRYIHTGTIRFKCDAENCDRGFIQKTDLHRHRFIAHGIYHKKFPCTFCNKVFSENALLRKHLANHE